MSNNPNQLPTTNAQVTGDYALSTLVSIDRVPIKFRHVFAQYVYFNRIQSAVIDDIFNADNSVVVSAPTGSGKTVLFELAIVSFLHKKDLSGSDYNFKIIYVAPVKALCEERMVDWHKKFSNVGLNCITVTGDSENVTLESLINHNLIITTPEKWDSLTRRWRTKIGVVGSIPLFLIDEVHLLNDETRGPTMEAIVSRMKTIESEKTDYPRSDTLRFVAVSATISNIEDIADWLSDSNNPAKSFNFSEELRPVKLQKIVKGYHYNPQLSNPFKFDLMLNYKLSTIIEQYCNGKPTLIFCSTRKSVEMTVKHVTQNLTLRLGDQQKQTLQDAAAKINMKAMEGTLVHGVGTHHAGLLPEQRRIIEELFRSGSLPILVTTSTLAMGVNLPAHLVIIKNTKCYTKCGYQDYTECALLQMIGRAGRPQFDSSATAVILTTSTDREKYEKMIGGTQPIESSLHKHLTEHLNAEVVLRTITDLGVAMQWLMSSFLYVRAQKNPKHYGLSPNLTVEQRNKKLIEICQIEINKLAKVGMITMDQTANIVPTNMGTLMAKYCIHFETMKLFTKIKGTEILQQLLEIISKCHEYSEMCLRVDDKKALNLLNKCKTGATIRFPLGGRIKTLDMKINCIIQAVFGCLQISDTSLLSEAQRIIRIGERVSKCLAEFLEGRERCFNASYSSLILAKCFQTRIWENSPYVSKQLTGIGIVTSNSLVAAGKTSFKALLDSNPRNLELIMHRKIPMGSEIQTQIEHIPEYRLVLEEVKVSEKKRKVKVKLDLLNYSKLVNQITVDPQSIMTLIVGDSNNDILLYEKYMHSYMIENPEIVKTLDEEFTSTTEIQGHFISENWSGIDCTVKLELFPVAKPKKAVKKTAKKTTTRAPESDLKWDKLSHIASKKYIDHYFKIVKKSALPKDTSDKESVPSNETELLQSDNDTGDVESTNQIDEMKLLQSSDDSGLDAACDAAETLQAEETTKNDVGEMSRRDGSCSPEVIIDDEEQCDDIYRDSESKYLEVCNKNLLSDIMQQRRLTSEPQIGTCKSAIAQTTNKCNNYFEDDDLNDAQDETYKFSPKNAAVNQSGQHTSGNKVIFRPKTWTTQQKPASDFGTTLSFTSMSVKNTSTLSMPQQQIQNPKSTAVNTYCTPTSSTVTPLLSTHLHNAHEKKSLAHAKPLNEASKQTTMSAQCASNNAGEMRYGTKLSVENWCKSASTNLRVNDGGDLGRLTPSMQNAECERRNYESANLVGYNERCLHGKSNSANVCSKNSSTYDSGSNLQMYPEYQGQDTRKNEYSCEPMRNTTQSGFHMSTNLNTRSNFETHLEYKGNTFEQNTFSRKQVQERPRNSPVQDLYVAKTAHYKGNTFGQNEQDREGTVSRQVPAFYMGKNVNQTEGQNEFPCEQIYRQNERVNEGTVSRQVGAFYMGKNINRTAGQNEFSCEQDTENSVASAFYTENMPTNADRSRSHFLPRQYDCNFGRESYNFQQNILSNDFSHGERNSAAIPRFEQYLPYKQSGVAPTSTIVDPNIPHNISSTPCYESNSFTEPEHEFSHEHTRQDSYRKHNTPRYGTNHNAMPASCNQTFSERLLSQLSQSKTHKEVTNNESFYSCSEATRSESPVSNNGIPDRRSSTYNRECNVREASKTYSGRTRNDFGERVEAQLSQVSERNVLSDASRKNLKRKLVQEAIRKTFAHGQRKESEYGIVETICPTSESRDEDGSRKSIKWSSPLVTSAESKYSPKLTNVSKSQTFNLRDKLRRTSRDELALKTASMRRKQAQTQFSRRTPGNVEDFPITDKQCGYTSKPCTINNDDIFSQSLINIFTTKHEPKVISQDAASLHKQLSQMSKGEARTSNKENVFKSEVEPPEDDYFSVSGGDFCNEAWPDEADYFEDPYPDPPFNQHRDDGRRAMFPRSNSATFAYTQPNVFEVQCYDYPAKVFPFASQDEYGYPPSPFVYQNPYPQFVPETRPMFFNCVDLEEQYRQMEADRMNTIINISHNRNYRPREASAVPRMRRFLSGELLRQSWDGNQRHSKKMRNDLNAFNNSSGIRTMGRMDANN